MKQTRGTLLSLILAATCGFSNAAPQEITLAGFAEARQQFIAAAGGDTKARDAAIEAFKALNAQHPGHPLLAAYEGSAVAMQGRDALMPWNKLAYAEKGANALEKALSQLTPAHDEMLFGGSPESIEVRLIAAGTLLALPEFMNRGALGKRAIEAALASPAFPGAAPKVRARVLLTAADIAGRDKRSADELAMLRQVLEIAPSSPQAKRATARLKELEK